MGWRGGSGCGGRCKSPSGARPSRWRLCVRALAKPCFASKAPSPMQARSPLARVRSPAHTARPGLGVLPNPPKACLGPMRLTPPQPAPPRLRQLAAICRNGVLPWWVSTLVDTVDPRHAWITHSISDRYFDQGRHLPTATGICQRWGGVGVRGVSRMDAAAKPTRTYLRRPRTPTPPHHPTGNPPLLLLLLLLLLQLPAGAGLQALPNTILTSNAAAGCHPRTPPPARPRRSNPTAPAPGCPAHHRRPCR